MNVTKSGTAAAAAEPISVDVTSADNSVVITKTEENKKTSFDLSVTKEKPVEVVGSDPKINVTKVSDIPSATYFLLSLNNVFSKEETAAKIDEKLVGLYKVKGSATLDEIKAKHAEIGDVYNCTTEGELNGEPVYPGDNIVAVSQTEHGLCNWDNLHGSISVATPSVELTSEKGSIVITKTEGADNKTIFNIESNSASPEGDFITKSGSFFYDTFSRDRRTTDYNYKGTVYPPTVGEKSICISSDVEQGSIASGANSHVEGDDNVVTGAKSFVTGEMNAVFSDNVTVHGNMHHVTNASEYAFVAGYGNEVQYGWCTAVLGKTNKAGAFQFIAGIDNEATGGSYSSIIGGGNSVKEVQHSRIIGEDNSVKRGSEQVFVLGRENNVNGSHVTMIGEGNSSEGSNSVILGFSNKDNAVSTASVIIGNNNVGNTVNYGSVILGSSNTNNSASCPYFIIGYNCNDFHPTAPAIALGERANSTPICGNIPLGLAIGVGQSRNIISADKAENVEIAAHSVVIGTGNQECVGDGTIIIGHGCEGWPDGAIFHSTAPRIVLGGHARPTRIDPGPNGKPLCLAIGNGNPDDPGNCIAADIDGNVKLYGNVLFDVDGVQYSMKQIVDALKSLNAL
ncbi:MAG: hypothetical protein MJZ19_08540 [Paludibacteraceae bacterium]|nr:hypothetical protein [Paludibacteraceae bacterium]